LKIAIRGKTYKENRGAKLQVFLYRKKITGRSPLRFLGKCAGRNLSVRDHFIPLMMQLIK